MKVIKLFLILVILVSLVGCKPTSDTVDVGEFFEIVSDELNATDYSVEPYFDDITKDNKYFKAVQTLVDWDILKVEYDFDLKNCVDKELFSKVITNISSVSLKEIDYNNEDLNRQNIVFFIKKAFKLRNEKIYNSIKGNVKLSEKIKYIEVINNSIKYDDKLVVGDIVAYEIDNVINYSKIVEINGENIILENASDRDIYEQLDIEGTFEIDLSEAEIKPLHDVERVNRNEISSIYIKTLATTRDDYNKFEYNGFVVYFNIKNNKIHVHALKKSDNNLNIYADLDIYSIKPTIKYQKDTSDSYFRLDFKTSESIGVKYGNYKDLYSDVKSIKSTNFLETLKKSFKSKRELVDTSIPIMELKIPIPEIPSVYIYLTLQLHIYASGRAELSLSNQNSIGFEIKNKYFRPIIENENDFNFVMRASLISLVGLKTTVEACNVKLMDIAAEGGIKGLMKSTVHILDNDKWIKNNSELPLDVLEQTLEGRNDLKVCGDLSLHWVLDTTFNSNKTLLGRFKMGKTFHFLDEKNQVFLNEYTHFENGLFVDKCTVNSKPIKKPKPTIEINSDRIKLEAYNIILHKGEEKIINILGIPKGYKLDDLVITSSDLGIVTNEGLKIYGNDRGSAEIIIKTNDNKYHAAVNVLVKK